MWPYIDLSTISAVCGSNRSNTPCGFTVLARRMADGNDYESCFVGIITLNQGERSLRKQTLAGLILSSDQLILTQFSNEEIRPIGKSRAARSPRGPLGRVSLLWNERAVQTEETSLRLAQAAALST
jgi:hypothetical protein